MGKRKNPRDEIRNNPAAYEKEVLVELENDELLNTDALQEKTVKELQNIAKSMDIDGISGYKKHEMIQKIVDVRLVQKGSKFYLGGGILQIQGQASFGFLRNIKENFSQSSEDIYISPQLIRKNYLREGDKVFGIIKPPKNEGEKYWAIMVVLKVNDIPLTEISGRPLFENLTPLFPDKKVKLEYDKSVYSTRVMDLFIPIGKGQRAMIVAPPRTGKTIILKQIAGSIAANHPEVDLIVLLIDERPEEVTDMIRSVKGVVISSTFDEPPHQQIQAATMTLKYAKRLVEMGRDVVILMDSLTRFARANNSVQPSSGRVLSGGLEASAVREPKKFFGAARNTEEGGSLTIVATALVDTGSRMDEVIFEEFKGTGNMEIHLDRNLSDLRLFPAINLQKSGTRKEEMLLSEEEYGKVILLRKILKDMNPIEQMEFILRFMKKTEDNTEFLSNMHKM
ncbi:transcription termination factor Rho [bacterium]|nr:transcription termination factor Rho [bacterium]